MIFRESMSRHEHWQSPSSTSETSRNLESIESSAFQKRIYLTSAQCAAMMISNNWTLTSHKRYKCHNSPFLKICLDYREAWTFPLFDLTLFLNRTRKPSLSCLLTGTTDIFASTRTKAVLMHPALARHHTDSPKILIISEVSCGSFIRRVCISTRHWRLAHIKSRLS